MTMSIFTFLAEFSNTNLPNTHDGHYHLIHASYQDTPDTKMITRPSTPLPHDAMRIKYELITRHGIKMYSI